MGEEKGGTLRGGGDSTVVPTGRCGKGRGGGYYPENRKRTAAICSLCTKEYTSGVSLLVLHLWHLGGGGLFGRREGGYKCTEVFVPGEGAKKPSWQSCIAHHRRSQASSMEHMWLSRCILTVTLYATVLHHFKTSDDPHWPPPTLEPLEGPNPRHHKLGFRVRGKKNSGPADDGCNQALCRHLHKLSDVSRATRERLASRRAPSDCAGSPWRAPKPVAAPTTGGSAGWPPTAATTPWSRAGGTATCAPGASRSRPCAPRSWWGLRSPAWRPTPPPPWWPWRLWTTC